MFRYISSSRTQGSISSKTIFLAGIIAGFLLSLSTTVCFAADYYVDTVSGADSNNGLSLESSWQTIGKANSELQPGDTVHIRAGVYNGDNNTIRPTASGSSDTARVTYTNYNGENVTITDASYGVRLEDKSYITITGINFDNNDRGLFISRGSHNDIGYCTFNKMRTYSWFGSRIHNDSQYNRIHHCNFSRWGQVVDRGGGNLDDWCGVLDLGTENDPGDESDYNLIEESTFFYGGHHVLRINSAHNILRNNYFHNEEWIPFGDKLYGNRNIEVYSPHGNWNLFEGNRLAFAGTPPDVYGASGIKLTTQNNIVRFNMMYHNGSSGVHLVGKGINGPNYPIDNHIYGNTIYHNGYDEVYSLGGLDFSGTPSQGNAVKNNILHDNINGKAIVALEGASLSDQIIENNWEEEGDPLFVDETAFDPFNPSLPDFRLQAASPCIDAGGFLTKTTASATNSTVIRVEDAGYFMDGWGMIEGDTIQFAGQTQKAKVTDVDYDNNIITVDTALSWQTGQGLSMAYSGTAPDMGAYEYTQAAIIYGDVSENGTISAYDAAMAAAYSVGLINLTANQITAAEVSGNGAVTATDASWIARKAVDPTIVFPVER